MRKTQCRRGGTKSDPRKIGATDKRLDRADSNSSTVIARLPAYLEWVLKETHEEHG